MKLKTKDLKTILDKIKSNEEYNNVSFSIGNVINNCNYSSDLFYTIEYADILINKTKKDNTFKNDFYQDTLKMLLYFLKNKQVSFDKKFFDLILELVKIYQGLIYDKKNKKFLLDKNYYQKINSINYNNLLFFTSIDYSNPFMENLTDELFNETINNIYDNCFIDLIDIYAYFKESKEIFEQLSNYSPIVCNLILKNSEYIKNLEYQKLEGYGKNFIEYNLFKILTSVFISNIKALNYNYSIISKTMNKLMVFVNENFFSLFNENNQISTENIDYLKQLMLDNLLELNTQKIKVLN